jgi:hypothetical protein
VAFFTWHDCLEIHSCHLCQEFTLFAVAWYSKLSTQSPVDGPLGCFYFLAIMSNCPMNFCIECLCRHVFMFSG